MVLFNAVWFMKANMRTCPFSISVVMQGISSFSSKRGVNSMFSSRGFLSVMGYV